jgi:hypothetical protein
VNAYIAGPDPFDWLRPTSDGLAAAIQIGIWETLYDDGAAFSLTGGAFQASGLEGATSTELAGILALLGSANPLNAALVMTLHTTGPNGQDLITGYREPLRVPEPGSLALLGLAAAAAGFVRRRKT